MAIADGDAVHDLEQLLSAMEEMPSNPSVALRALWVADDPRANAPELANALELDAALTARLLRVANSAYYSRGSRVTNVPRAVVTVGFATVQALAAAAVTGLDDTATLPSGFWDHSAQVAHGSGLLARHFGVAANDAFAAGLLHDLGEGVMCRIAPNVWAELETATSADSPERLQMELDLFGATHDRVGERILRAWHLPDSLCDTVGTHHQQSDNPLVTVLTAGARFASLACGELTGSEASAAEEALSSMGITSEFIAKVGPRLASEAKALASAFK